MASREEEKAARRQARIAAQERERRAAQRRKRLWVVLGTAGVVAVAAVAVALAVSRSGASSEEADAGSATASGVTLPAAKTADLDDAVKAAGCKLRHPATEGQGHADKTFTAADYRTNPPTSGTHFPEWSQDGVYEAGNTPPLGKLVHTLEHGRINIQYSPGTPAGTVKQFEALVAENGGYHVLLYQNATKMKATVAATAWNQMLSCERVTPRLWDALRTFRDRYVDKAPEQVP